MAQCADFPQQPPVPDWHTLRAAISRGITRSATARRTDRLFPGSSTRPATAASLSGLGFARGAAGVLYALHAAGTPVPGEYEHWLLHRAAGLPADARLGFHDGAHGIAYVLDLLGHTAHAHRLLAAALDARWQRLGADLADGLAGIGLNLLHFAERTGDAALRAAALEAGRLTVELLAQEHTARALADHCPGTRALPTAARGDLAGHAGLLRGACGPALLFLRLYEHTADTDWLERAGAALRMDLACCTRSRRDRSLRVGEGLRATPYLAEGSAGIALVVRRYLAHREDEELRAALEAIERACVCRLCAHPGLFDGRAGLLLALADAETWTGAAGAWTEAALRPADTAALADAAHSAGRPGFCDTGAAYAHAAGLALASPARAARPAPASTPAAATAAAAAVHAVPPPAPSAAAPGLPPRRGVAFAAGVYVPGVPGRAHPGHAAAPPAARPPRGGPHALEQARRLVGHGLERGGALVFPGDRWRGASADLATGAAGVLLALAAVLGESPAHLPFLGPPRLPRAGLPRPAGSPPGRAAPRAAR